MNDNRLRGISCFSGIGGLDLSLQEDVRTVCYIEYDSYCRKVIKKRASEGWLDVAPIWDDIKSFDGRRWRGRVDIVFGGFPCQDISFAGKGAGIKEGTRSGLFFELMRVIGEVRPKFIFLENVSAINRRGIEIVLGSLSQAGYDARWMHLRASDVGAPHRRERWFCLGYTDSAYDGSQRIHGQLEKQIQRLPDFSWCEDVRRVEDFFQRPNIPEPLIRGKDNGVPKRVDRLKCLGNAVVPQQGRYAWKMLTNQINRIRDVKEVLE